MIRFEHVTKRYRGTKHPALDDVDFEVLRGEFVFLVGASGSGKSTCLRLILREDVPTKGRVRALGHDLRKMSNRKVPYFRRSIGSVFQDFRLLPTKTVGQNVAFALQVTGSSRGFIHAAVPEALTLVGLGDKAKRMPHELSGGEQQRVAIARAIVNRPDVLLADEPTGNLDPATSTDIMRLLARINANGTTVIMATHEAGFVDQMQRRVIELQDGAIVRDERHGGYGDTSAIPRLHAETERGAASTAALTEVRELREQISAAVAVVESTADDAPAEIAAAHVDVAADADAGWTVTEAVSQAHERAAAPTKATSVPTAAADPSPAVPAAAPVRTASSTPAAPAAAAATTAAAPAPATTKPAAAPVSPAASSPATADPSPAITRPAAAPEPAESRPLTMPIPVQNVEIAELGVADRLGLGEFDDDDEVGPTT